MAIHELAAMTWEEVAALPASRVVAILPVGATEAHGPHLPISTDVVIADAMARAGAARLASHGLVPLLLPAIAYTPVPFAASFAGSLGVSESTLRDTVRDIAAALAEHGITTLAIANAHLDPTHLRALDAAVGVTRAPDPAALAPDPAQRAAIVFPNIVRRAWAARLTDEFRSGACHAGQFETSILLAAAPHLVRDSMRSTLAPVDASLSEAIGAGLHTFVEAGGPRAYFGSPATASADEGRSSIDALGRILEEAVLQSRAANVHGAAAS